MQKTQNGGRVELQRSLKEYVKFDSSTKAHVHSSRSVQEQYGIF
jgi:hypothetical protein